ncbi:MAG: PAS domain-containing protein, partial [Anaerolineae bacterium]|nr:PAS domain-containing protein [Anaerolineae bacterium]
MFNKTDLETIRGFCKDEDSFQQMLEWMGQREVERQGQAFNPQTRLQQIFHHFPDAILLTEAKPDGCILDVNAAFEQLTGFSPEEVIGMRGEVFWGRPDERHSYLHALSTQGHV